MMKALRQVHQSKNVESCLTCLVWTRLDQLCPRYRTSCFLYDWSRYTLAPIFGEIGPRETCRLRSRCCCWAILSRPFLNTPEYVNFHHFLTLCKGSKLFEHVKALKKPLLLPGKKKKIILTISIGPLTIRCSGPNNNNWRITHKVHISNNPLTKPHL